MPTSGMVHIAKTFLYLRDELAKKADKADHTHIVNDDGTTSTGMPWPKGGKPEEADDDGK